MAMAGFQPGAFQEDAFQAGEGEAGEPGISWKKILLEGDASEPGHLHMASDIQEQIGAIKVTIGAVGSAIPTGYAGDVFVPFALEITRVTMLADQSGSVVVDLWNDSYANYPPTDADSITASAPPTITTDDQSQDATLTGWTTAIAAGSTLRYNVDSVTDIEQVEITLDYMKL